MQFFKQLLRIHHPMFFFLVVQERHCLTRSHLQGQSHTIITQSPRIDHSPPALDKKSPCPCLSCCRPVVQDRDRTQKGQSRTRLGVGWYYQQQSSLGHYWGHELFGETKCVSFSRGPPNWYLSFWILSLFLHQKMEYLESPPFKNG